MTRKKIVNIILSVVLFAGLFLLVGYCIKICAVDSSRTNTRETAVELVHGVRDGRPLADGEDYWFYFVIDKTTLVALDYMNDNNVASYFYAESDTADDAEQLVGNGFETRELSAGKYFIRLHVLQSGMFGRSMASVTYMIVDDLPAMPMDTEQKLSMNKKTERLENGYYTLDLTEDRSDFTAKAEMPEYLAQRIYFYYGENNSESDSFYFYKAKDSEGEYSSSSSTITLPAGRTIIEISTYVSDSRIKKRPDATVLYTATKAALGTAFDREVSVLPELSFGKEQKMCEMFDLEIDNFGRSTYGLNSTKLDLTEDSIVSVRVKNYSQGSMSVYSYYNTNPLNSVKHQGEGASFHWSEYIEDTTKTFTVSAGLNLIELRVTLTNYSAQDFAKATIEFNISPANE